MDWNSSMQPRITEQLKQAIERDRLAHAYLFYGPKGVGKMQTAQALAQAINCESSSVGEICGSCSTCIQIEGGNHPDVILLRPDGAFIKIAQVREMQARWKLSPATGFTRVLLIEQADRMREEAANSLLKFLEEPLSPMLAILLTENRSDILATIQSRCHILRFPELPPEKRRQQWINQGFSGSVANLLSHLPDPNMGDKNEEQIITLMQQIGDWGKQLLTPDKEAFLILLEPWLQTEMEQSHGPLILDMLLLWMRDVLNQQMGRASKFYSNLPEPVAIDQILQTMDQIWIARKKLEQPSFSQASIMEQMVLSLDR